MIPCSLKLAKKTKRKRRQNNRWRQFDPQVKMHYAHTVFLCSYMHASILDSISSPPCNNLRMLCIKSSIPSGDWNKMDITLGGWFVKYMLIIYRDPRHPENFDRERILSFNGTIKTFMRCDRQTARWDLWLWDGLLILRDTLRKRWERATDEEEELGGWRGGREDSECKREINWRK